MFEHYGIEIAKLFKRAEGFRKELRHPYVGSEHLLLAILEEDNEISRKLKVYGLSFDKFKNELVQVVGMSNKDTDFVLYTPLLKRVIENATNDAVDTNKGKVTERHLFLSLLEEGEGIAIRILLGLDIDLDALYDELKVSLVSPSSSKLEILEIGNNLNKSVSDTERVIGREEEISSVIEALLRKKKSNPLLLGKAGVGKTAIVEELARRINHGLVPTELLGKTIVSLEMGALVSGTKYRGEFEERLSKIIKEVIENKNIILFIDEIHTMVNAGGAEGAINAADILKPYLARGEIKCIGATTTDEYYKTIFKDKALERRFFTIDVKEPDEEKTKEILLGIKSEYEHHHDLKISDQNICDIVTLANKYMPSKSNPDKCIDLLDLICASKKMKTIPFEELESLNKELENIKKQKEKNIYEDNYEQAALCKQQENLLVLQIKNLMGSKENCITYEDILHTISKKTSIPLLEDKKALFGVIKQNLETNILGEEKAVRSLLKNIWFKFNGYSKPLSLLLVGPSGVGKTESVKTIAKSISNSKLIRLDMSEYNLDTSVNKLIGVSAGYVGYDDDYIFRSVLDNPYSIILVDEIEKAHPRVLNLFLQILDEGFVTNAKGEKIDFQNTMIFMTSNVVNGEAVGFMKQSNDALSSTFSKEFLGRFTGVVPFEKLGEEVLSNYVKENLKDTKVIISKLIEEAECDKFGLRNLKHLILKYNSELDIEIPL